MPGSLQWCLVRVRGWGCLQRGAGWGQELKAATRNTQARRGSKNLGNHAAYYVNITKYKNVSQTALCFENVLRQAVAFKRVRTYAFLDVFFDFPAHKASPVWYYEELQEGILD